MPSPITFMFYFSRICFFLFSFLSLLQTGNCILLRLRVPSLLLGTASVPRSSHKLVFSGITAFHIFPVTLMFHSQLNICHSLITCIIYSLSHLLMLYFKNSLFLSKSNGLWPIKPFHFFSFAWWVTHFIML